MKLDDYANFAQLDSQNMLAEIDGLPGQIENAWRQGQDFPLPDWKDLDYVLISGMGGSAIGASLLEAYLRGSCPIPIIVHRDYGLPSWASGPHTLVIASSHSGNTEETLSSFQEAVAKGCRVLSVCTGGKLAQDSRQAGVPLWTFTHQGQPRAAVGFSFGLLLAAFTRLGLTQDPSEEIRAAVVAMRRQQDQIQAQVPTTQNLAKRIAGQLIGRYVTVFGSGLLSPVSRRWKGQVSEIAKSWAQFEFLPEADHNTLAGTQNPESLLNRMMALFLVSPSDHPRDRLRSELTRKTMMVEGINTDIIAAEGDIPLAHMWTLLHLGDYVAYYLAMAYEVDPTPVAALESFKAELAAIK